MIRVLIAGDVTLYVDGLAHTLGLHPEFEARAITCSGPEALREFLREQPDVVLIDMTMCHCQSMVLSLRETVRDQLILALAVPETEQGVISAAESGLSGYVPRTATVAQLANIIREALQGKIEMPPQIAASLFQRVSALSSARYVEDATNVTRREMEIARLVDQGLSNKEIACLLGIEVSTVKNHVHNLLEKTNATRRSEIGARLRHHLLRAEAPVPTATVGHAPPSFSDRKLA